MSRLRRLRFWSVALLLGVLILLCTVVYAQVGGQFNLSWSAITGGGATASTAGSYSLGGTIVQPGTGRQSGGQFIIDGGFWSAALGGPSVTPTRTSTRTATPLPSSTPSRTRTPLPTQTPGGPTATPVPTDTHVPSHTTTPTRTSTPTPSRTPSPLPTQTPGGPTATLEPTQTPTLTPTSTPTPLPTQTPGGPTATPAPSETPTEPAGGTPTPTACTLQFTDVPPDSTFYPYIRCMACRGIVNGYTSGCQSGNPCFRPGNNVTRGQLSKIVSNSAGFQDPPSSQLFQDVPPDSTFYDYSFRLATRNIISGYLCGTIGEPCIPPNNLPYFRPNNNATRGQISKIVSNAAGFQDPSGAQIFEDVPPGSTFYDFIQRLASRGVMNGYPCGAPGEPCNPPNNLPYFRPSNNATRGQTSKIVANTFFPGCNPPSGLYKH